MAERQSARMSKITNDRLNPVWQRMLYSCTHMATVGVKGLNGSCFGIRSRSKIDLRLAMGSSGEKSSVV